MNTCCKQNIVWNTIYSENYEGLPTYRLKCMKCGYMFPQEVVLANIHTINKSKSKKHPIWESYYFDTLKILYYYKITAKLRRLKCRFFGHKNVRPMIQFSYNTLTGLRVDKNVNDISMVCGVCGKQLGGMFEYDRLMKVKKLFKKSK